MKSRSVETNFKIIANNKVNREILLILNKLRSMIHKKEKGVLTINVDATHGELIFEYTINGNEIEFIRLSNTFQI